MSFQTRIHWVDVNPNLAAGTKEPPTFFLERELLHGSETKGGVFNIAEVARKGRFWTVTTPLTEADDRWALTREGQYVRIPLYGYTVPLLNGPVLLASGFELALRFLELWYQQCRGGETIEVLHIVLHPETHTVENGVRLYAGVSLQTQGD